MTFSAPLSAGAAGGHTAPGGLLATGTFTASTVVGPIDVSAYESMNLQLDWTADATGAGLRVVANYTDGAGNPVNKAVASFGGVLNAPVVHMAEPGGLIPVSVGAGLYSFPCLGPFVTVTATAAGAPTVAYRLWGDNHPRRLDGVYTPGMEGAIIGGQTGGVFGANAAISYPLPPFAGPCNLYLHAVAGLAAMAFVTSVDYLGTSFESSGGGTAVYTGASQTAVTVPVFLPAYSNFITVRNAGAQVQAISWCLAAA